MTALALLEQVAAAGVQIRVVGADLVIQPKGTLPCELRAQLAANKPQVRALLDPEIRWRVEIMNPQVPPWPAPVLGLLARTALDPGVDDCFSCGDPLPRWACNRSRGDVDRVAVPRGWCWRTGRHLVEDEPNPTVINDACSVGGQSSPAT